MDLAAYRFQAVDCRSAAMAGDEEVAPWSNLTTANGECPLTLGSAQSSHFAANALVFGAYPVAIATIP
jgi:predicted aspartyl protease